MHSWNPCFCFYPFWFIVICVENIRFFEVPKQSAPVLFFLSTIRVIFHSIFLWFYQIFSCSSIGRHEILFLPSLTNWLVILVSKKSHSSYLLVYSWIMNQMPGVVIFVLDSNVFLLASLLELRKSPCYFICSKIKWQLLTKPYRF
jgi:hypothetical protein